MLGIVDGPAWSLATGTLFLALAAATAAARRQDGVTVSFATMAILIAVHETLEFADDLGGGPSLDRFELGTAFLAVVPTLFFFVGFVGMRRRLQPLLLAISAVFVTLAVFVALGYLGPEEPLTSRVFLSAFFPAVLLMVGVLALHIARTRGETRLRTLLLLAVLALGAGGVLTNLAHNAGAQIPPLMQPGLIGGAAVMALLARRGELIFGEWLFALTIGVLSAVVVVAHFLVLSWAGERLGLATASTVVVILLAFVTAQPLWASWSEVRSRQIYLGTLGRLSAQMAHDLRNPLGAIRMAGEIVLADAQAGRPLERRLDHLELIVEQTRRMESVIANYQRLGRCEASPRLVDVGEVARMAADNDPSRHSLYEGSSLVAEVDPELLTLALENLVRNAREASPPEAPVVVRARSEFGTLEIEVEDRGHGMDPATAERALDDFYTTRSEGTGLGLSFVRRVAEAHGGHVDISSSLGEGTKVKLTFPKARPEGSAGSAG